MNPVFWIFILLICLWISALFIPILVQVLIIAVLVIGGIVVLVRSRGDRMAMLVGVILLLVALILARSFGFF